MLALLIALAALLTLFSALLLLVLAALLVLVLIALLALTLFRILFAHDDSSRMVSRQLPTLYLLQRECPVSEKETAP
ncbi:MAG TPA: hypothetical protein VJM53_03995 [Burkholderiales bacterium]|nr:hypothetical protein [Burkholderiales bacterium]